MRVVAFQDLEQDTIDAIQLFGDSNTARVVLEKSYQEYLSGKPTEEASEDTTEAPEDKPRCYLEVVQDLQERFPDAQDIATESDKKEFVKLFGEYLKLDNILQNYDEYASLKAVQTLDLNDPEAVEAFKLRHHVDDSQIATM